MMLSVCGIGTALALRFGGIGVIHGQMTLGALATFLQIVFFIQFPVQELTNAITQDPGRPGIRRARAKPARCGRGDPGFAGSHRANSRITRPTTPIRTSRSTAWIPRVHSIEFRNVGFAYKGGQTVLRDFNLRVRAGESIALVGPTGGGKTTIVGLACRFYEPTSGQILINGIDYRERSLKWLQSNLGMVLQQPLPLQRNRAREHPLRPADRNR